MTTADVLAALRRRWVVAALGLLLSVLAAWHVSRVDPVYETRVDVFFIPPPTPAGGASGVQAAATAMAGLVQRELVSADEPAPVSPDLRLSDTGVYDGTSVVLPNSGGQWTYSFNEAVLRISATAPDAEEAERRRDALSVRVTRTLRSIQARDRVPQSRMIRTRSVPDRPAVVPVYGYPTRSGATVGLLGLGLTVVGTVLLDRVRLRRQTTVSRSMSV